jgi:hypothetical protein
VIDRKPGIDKRAGKRGLPILRFAGKAEEPPSKPFQDLSANNPGSEKNDDVPAGAKNAIGFLDRMWIENILGRESSHEGVKAVGRKRKVLGEASSEEGHLRIAIGRCLAQSFGDAHVRLPAHLPAFIQSERLKSSFPESNLEVTRAVAQLQHPVPVYEGQDSQDPTVPTAQRNDPRNKIITPGEGVIQMVKDDG